MDYATFNSKKDAQKEIATMRGWDARACRLGLGYDDNGNAIFKWVIEITGYGDPKYLRRDGYVR